MSRYILTTEHAASSYGQPVLVDTETNIAYGLADVLSDGTPAAQLYEQLSHCEGPSHAAQDSLNFTEHLNRIEYLSSLTLLHVQKENYQKAREDLNNIHAHATAAQQQLDKFQWIKSQGGISSEGFGL